MIGNRFFLIGIATCLVFAFTGCSPNERTADIPIMADATNGYAAVDTTAASKQFEKIKSLAGNWYLTGGNQLGNELKPNLDVPFLTYSISAGGHCVIEKLFAGQPKEMTTIYHMDRGHLALEHYCSLGNQPTMLANPGDDKEIVFFLTGVGNMTDPNDLHISSHSLAFTGADELTAHWGATKDQAEANQSVFHVVRKPTR